MRTFTELSSVIGARALKAMLTCIAALVIGTCGLFTVHGLTEIAQIVTPRTDGTQFLLFSLGFGLLLMGWFEIATRIRDAWRRA